MTPSSRTCVFHPVSYTEPQAGHVHSQTQDRWGVSKGAHASTQRWSETFLHVLVSGHQAQEQSQFHYQITPFCLASFFLFICIEREWYWSHQPSYKIFFFIVLVVVYSLSLTFMQVPDPRLLCSVQYYSTCKGVSGPPPPTYTFFF